MTLRIQLLNIMLREPMRIWVYNGKKYTFSARSLEDDMYSAVDIVKSRRIVYHHRWNKCYYINSVGYSGCGNKLKACVEDIYSGRKAWTNLRDLRTITELTHDENFSKL